MASNTPQGSDGGAAKQDNGAAVPTDAEMQQFAAVVKMLLTTMQTKIEDMSANILSKIDEMGTRVDEMERTMQVFMQKSGVDKAAVDKLLQQQQNTPGSQ